MKTETELAIIQALGPIIGGVVQTLRGIGETQKADVIANTFAADANWRRVMADDPNASPTQGA